MRRKIWTADSFFQSFLAHAGPLSIDPAILRVLVDASFPEIVAGKTFTPESLLRTVERELDRRHYKVFNLHSLLISLIRHAADLGIVILREMSPVQEAIILSLREKLAAKYRVTHDDLVALLNAMARFSGGKNSTVTQKLLDEMVARTGNRYAREDLHEAVSETLIALVEKGLVMKD
jgi:hypothetical protein